MLADGVELQGHQGEHRPQGARGEEGEELRQGAVGGDLMEQLERRGGRGRTEEDPREGHIAKRRQPGQRLGEGRGRNLHEDVAVEKLIDHEAHAVEQAPDDEHARGPMPYACDEHSGKVVEVGAQLSTAVAPQRDIDVVAKPGGEGDVPAVPKLREARGLVGEAEVVLQAETHQGGQSDRQVAIAREVAEDLHGESDHAHEALEARVVGGRVEDPVVVLGDVVGDDHLLDDAQENQPQALVGQRAAWRQRVGVLLRDEYFGARDGSRHEEGEEGEVEGVFQQRCGGGKASAIDIDRVADGLEGVEGNAQRHEEFAHGQVLSHHGADGTDEGTRVLEVEEWQERDEDVGDEQATAALRRRLCCHAARDPPREQRRRGEEEHQQAVGLEGEEEAESRRVGQQTPASARGFEQQVAEEEHQEGRHERYGREGPRRIGGCEEVEYRGKNRG